MPSANDNFANRETVSITGFGTYTGSTIDTTGNTSESGEPNSSLAATRSAWYEFTPTVNGNIIMSTNTSWVLGIHTGTAVNALTQVASESSLSANQLTNGVRLTAGTSYKIQLGFSNHAALVPVFEYGAEPANDMWANAQDLSVTGYGLWSSTTVSGRFAGRESGEPNSGLSEHTLWYKFTAPANGYINYRVDTTGGETPRIASYTGSAVNSLTQLDNSTSTDNVWLESRRAVTAGTTYYIQVGNATTDSVLTIDYGAAVWSHLVTNGSTSNLSSYTSGSFTPQEGVLLVAMCGHATFEATAATLTASANGITFTHVVQATRASVDTVHLFVADQLVPASPSSMTVTYNPGGACTGAVISVAALKGMTKYGATAVRQSLGNNGAGAATPQGSFAAATVASSPLTAFVFSATSPAALTPPTNWIERVDSGFSTPTRGYEYATRTSGATSSAVTYGGTSATAWAIVAAEFDGSFTVGQATETDIAQPITALGAYPSAVVADAPLAYWRLGEASGTTLTDSSGNGRTGTYTAPPTLGTAGLLTGDSDTAATFDGSTQYATVTDAAWMDTTALTVEAWVDTTATGLRTITARRGSGFQWRFYLDGGGLRFEGGAIASGGSNLNDGNPHHVAATYDGTDVRLYADGTLLSTTAMSVTLSGAEPIVLGRNSTTNYYSGILDEVAVYGTALSGTRVSAHHQAGTGASAATVTLAGDLPALTGAIQLLSSLDASLAGDLPALTGAFDLATVEPATVSLAGDLPALTSTFDLTVVDAPATVDLAGTLPALTGAFSLATAEPATVSLAGDLPALTAAFSLTVADPPATMTLAGTLPALTGSLSLELVPPPTTDENNRAGGRERDGLGVATWDPAVVAPPAGTVLAYDVASAFGPITRTKSRPTYTVDTARVVRSRERLVVGGKDVTFYRDVPTPSASYQLIEPLLYGPATLTFPQIIAHVEEPGVGALKWLRKGGVVKVQRVNATGEVVATDYRGIIVAFNTDGRNLTVEVGGQAAGRAALRNKQVPIFRAVRDIGRLAHDSIRALGLEFSPHLGPTTGIELARFGGMSHLDYISELCAKAWTRDGNQWTIMPDDDGVYRLSRKDTTTIDATVYLDDARVVANLRRDVAEEPNRIFMTGVDPEGRRLRNAIYPGLNQGPAPDYPMNDNSSFGEGTTDEDTDTGDGIAVMVNRLRTMKYLDRPETPGGYDDDAVKAVKALQDDAGLSETGVMNPATWKALFDLTATGYSLRGSRIEPMAQRSKVKKWNRTSSGAKKSRNPNYDPSVTVVDLNVDAGLGFTHDQLREWARAELSTEDNWVGTINLTTGAVVAGEHNPGDPLDTADVMPARDLRPGMNLWAPQFMGGTLFHISGISVTGDGAVGLSVDTRARDTMKVWQIIQRNRESRHDPARAWVQQHRSSTMSNDAVGEWDTAGGYIDAVPCPGGEWTVFPVPAGQEGTIRSLRIRTQDAQAEFVVAIFGRKVTPRWLSKRVPAPLTPPTTYTDTVDGEEVTVRRRDNSARWESEAVRKRLDNRYLLYAAGTDKQPCGYFPGRKTNDNDERTKDPITGRHEDDAGISYHTFAEPVLYVAIFPDRDTTVKSGRIMWNQLEAV